jgi:hypothetical protein
VLTNATRLKETTYSMTISGGESTTALVFGFDSDFKSDFVSAFASVVAALRLHSTR